MTRKKKSAASSAPDVASAGLPADVSRFWRAAIPLETLHPPDGVDRTPTLQRLGSLPFSGSGFPVMGFLATLFEHVANSAREALISGNDSIPKGSA